MTTPTLPPATPENPIRLVPWVSTSHYVKACELCRTTPEQSPGQWYYDIRSSATTGIAVGDYCEFCADFLMATGRATRIPIPWDYRHQH